MEGERLLFAYDENMIVDRQKKKGCASSIRQSLLAALAMIDIGKAQIGEVGGGEC
ncbi:hypothetical protein HP398_06385 [Brevibacillus sp. HB1.4B]|uniref:hypothetical protein n=1 Tax=Brevibacillus TaxID=55080 RepID=UPI000ADE347E|nr:MULTISPECIES: hypothetical protein [Brevibacillus]MED1802553.1 hypothetical protein [Brevibacillus porteri]MED2134199.1 hypothetical protein [Brevibacillus porteri]MED2894168.1 hypothetical protein [Brevibacillus porteri]NRS16061.1 hypothetical protein [Brevibacillus sp. HB1.4B]